MERQVKLRKPKRQLSKKKIIALSTGVGATLLIAAYLYSKNRNKAETEKVQQKIIDEFIEENQIRDPSIINAIKTFPGILVQDYKDNKGFEIMKNAGYDPKLFVKSSNSKAFNILKNSVKIMDKGNVKGVGYGLNPELIKTAIHTEPVRHTEKSLRKYRPKSIVARRFLLKRRKSF